MADDLTNAAFAAQLADLFANTAKQVDTFIDENEDDLRTSGDFDQLTENVQNLRDASDKLAEQAEDLAFNGSEDCFSQLKAATKDVQIALDHIADVNKIISIAGAAVTLAASILTGNVEGIGTAIEGVIAAAAAPADGSGD
jgi:hypothetical protein